MWRSTGKCTHLANDSLMLPDVPHRQGIEEEGSFAGGEWVKESNGGDDLRDESTLEGGGSEKVGEGHG